MTEPSIGDDLAELVRLRPDAAVVNDSPDGTGLGVRHVVQRLGPLDAAQHAMLDRVRTGWHTTRSLLGPPSQRRGEHAESAVLLARMRRHNWLSVRLRYHNRPLLTLRPTTVGVPAGDFGAVPEHPCTLSRFTVLRRRRESLRLESPYAPCVIDVVDADLMAAMARLCHPLLPSELTRWIPEPVAERVLTLLHRYRFTVGADDSEEDDLRSAQWSPHELWFHSRSRLGRHDLAYGGTYWAEERFPAVPLRHPGFGGAATALHRPRPGSTGDAATLDDVLDQRRSVREQHAASPLTAAQLGDFLYRCARSRQSMAGRGQELSRRPYPGGGAIYELEIYPLVNAVVGLPAGLYHYEPHDHTLERVPARSVHVDRLVAAATEMALLNGPPQVLFVLAARFDRFMWKYQTMAYAAILKNVGALYTTMYLVATAMGLAPCALGGGDSDAFALATGLDYFTESSVGEFVLGARCPPDVGTGSAPSR